MWVTFNNWDRGTGAGTGQSGKFGTGTGAGTGRSEKIWYGYGCGYGSIWKNLVRVRVDLEK